MKKCLKNVFLLLFFLAILSFSPAFFNNEKFVSATKKPCQEEMVFEFDALGAKFKFLSKEILPKLSLSEMQKDIVKSKESRFEAFKKVSKFIPDEFDALVYCYPELETIFEKISNYVFKDAKETEVVVIKNSCKIDFEDAVSGRYLDKQDFSQKFIKEISQNKNKIYFDLKVNTFKKESEIKENMKEKGCFSTNFSSSGEARKNNIRVALSSFDGLILEEGEILSFNQTTGLRLAETGYMPAKIISGGTFTEGFGGGVCQVSTTLYNACLLAGLEIVEVHNHSLPVSYIEPSFDAMVNSGSSDLVIRNNSGGKLVFTTSYKNDVCKVKIFGIKNKYKITRHSEKTKIIPAEPDIVVSDYKKYGVEIGEGEEKRLSFSKDGFCSNGYLNYYGTDGELIETKKIRSNRYNPTKGIIVKREK